MRPAQRLTAFAAAAGLLFCAGASAMSKDEYQAGNERIKAEYESARAACKSLSGNANDICMKQAAAGQTIARTELKAQYEPSAANRYDARVKKAEALYSVAVEKCDDLAGNPKDVCVKEAKADRVAGRADAKASRQTADANGKADRKVSQARATANSAKNDADYAVAKERCDVYAAEAKTVCLDRAKVSFGKS